MKKVPYTPFQKEKKLRIEVQIELLKEQMNRIQKEYDAHCQEILATSNAEIKEDYKVKFYRDHFEVESPKRRKGVK
jgi:hypothetical protein